MGRFGVEELCSDHLKVYVRSDLCVQVERTIKSGLKMSEARLFVFAYGYGRIGENSPSSAKFG